VREPLVALAIALVGSLMAGPVVAYLLEFVPQQRQRAAQWSLILGAVLVAVIADLASEGPVGGAVIYLIAILPGLITYLAFRTLVASTFVSFAPLYFFIAQFARTHPAHVPELALDRAIGVEPTWMLVYASLYIFIIPLPVLVVRQPELFRRGLQGYLSVMLFAYVCFLAYPTVAQRPDEVPGDGFAAWSLRILYDVDPPYNCFPSLHVAYSFVAALACSRVHRGVGVVATMWAALIGVSTLYTKQHYVVDVIAGALSASVAYLLFLRTYPREMVPEIERRRAAHRALGAAAIYAVMVVGFWLAYQTSLAGN
jgi:membrane-associated phospholipid phosphatase